MADPLNPQTSPLPETTLTPGMQWAQSNSPSLKKTRLGLSLIHYMIEITLVVLIVMFFGASFVDHTIDIIKGMTTTIKILTYISVIIIQIVAPLLCLSVPDESESRKYLFASIAFYVLNIIKFIIQMIAPMIFPMILFRTLEIFSLVGTIMFVLFMKRLSEYIGRSDLALRSRNIIVAWSLCFLLSLPIFFSHVLGLEMILIIGAFVSLLMFWYMVDDLRKSLGKIPESETA